MAKFLSPSAKIIIPDDHTINGDSIIKFLEKIGRVCYKSESLITDDSAKTFIKKILKNKHLTVIEHVSLSVRVICDRGISHAIVRHRLASYSQESTCYCNYAKKVIDGDTDVHFILPCFIDESTVYHKAWKAAMLFSEKLYKFLIAEGVHHQKARNILPTSVKTEIIITMNLRNWRHFLETRLCFGDHPQMQEIARLILEELHTTIPIVFDDIYDNYYRVD